MSDVIIPYRFKVRGGTAADLATVNEIPIEREMVFEIDTLKSKLGDGVNHYNDLDYISSGGGGSSEGGIGIQIGTLTSTAIPIPSGTQVGSISEASYSLSGDWFMWCYPSGSVTIDVWRDVFGTIPNVADTICSTPPAVVGGTFASGSFTGPINIDRSDTIVANVNASTGVKWVKLLLIGDKA